MVKAEGSAGVKILEKLFSWRIWEQHKGQRGQSRVRWQGGREGW